MKSIILSLFALEAEAKVRPMAPYKKNLEDPEFQAPKRTHVRKMRSPIVEAAATNCEKECIFKDINNYWCMETVSPMLVGGWTWSQASDTTYWNI